MKKIYWAFLLFILVVGAGILVFFQEDIVQDDTSELPNAASVENSIRRTDNSGTTEDNVSKYETYQNENLGISFEYPKDKNYQPDMYEENTIRLMSENGGYLFEFKKHQTEQTLSEWYEQNKENYPIHNEEPQEVKEFGHEGYRLNHQKAMQVPVDIYFLKLENHIWEISFPVEAVYGIDYEEKEYEGKLKDAWREVKEDREIVFESLSLEE